MPEGCRPTRGHATLCNTACPQYVTAWQLNQWSRRFTRYQALSVLRIIAPLLWCDLFRWPVPSYMCACNAIERIIAVQGQFRVIQAMCDFQFPFFTHPSLINRSRSGWPLSNFVMNQIFLENRMFRLSDGEEMVTLAFLRFDTIPECDRQTNGHTDGHSFSGYTSGCKACCANALVKTRFLVVRQSTSKQSAKF